MPLVYVQTHKRHLDKPQEKNRIVVFKLYHKIILFGEGDRSCQVRCFKFSPTISSLLNIGFCIKSSELKKKKLSILQPKPSTYISRIPGFSVVFNILMYLHLLITE